MNRRDGPSAAKPSPIPDRRVHAECVTFEVVRYERAGKWYVEPRGDGKREAVGVVEAAHRAVAAETLGGEVNLGLPGGSMFDRCLLSAEQGADIGASSSVKSSVNPAKRKGDPKVAQSQAQYALKIGLLRREPCERCGALEVDAHHDDYTRPLQVRWLCRAHHSDAHRDVIMATRARGERCGTSKLSDSQIAEIRRRHRVVHPAQQTGCSSSELAREFGITRQYVAQLMRGLWRVG